jgi:hypothetical protein
MAYPDEWPFSRWSDTLSCFLALERLANEAGLTHTETRVADFHFSQGMVKAFAYPALEKIGMER